MKNLFRFLSLSIVAVVLWSCSETTSTEDNPYIKVEAQMTSNTINQLGIVLKNPDVQIGAIDSIIIKDFRILLSRLKFQVTTADNDSNAKEHELKAGPFLLILDSTGKSFVLANGEIPAGTYSKIKFELHRFASSELSQYANNAVFKDFATQERYSVIIKGLVFIDGSAKEFTFNGTPTANLMLNFSPEIAFNKGEEYVIQMSIDPSKAFLSSRGEFLEPTAPANQNDINNAIKDAFKSVKKK